MKVLVVAELKDKHVIALKNAFKEKGFQEAEYINIGQISLLSEEKGTSIKTNSINFEDFDGCFIIAKPQFTQFIEPFLDELSEKGIYSQVKPESYYLASNESFQLASLNSKGIKIPDTIIIDDPALMVGIPKEIPYPILLRTFKGIAKTQSIIIESDRTLKSLAKSMGSEHDAIMLRKHLEGNLDQCVVIGNKILVVQRKWDDNELGFQEKGVSIGLTETEQKTAVKAAKTVGCDIATVRMIKGHVISVVPEIDFGLFNNTLGEVLYLEIASFYAERLK